MNARYIPVLASLLLFTCANACGVRNSAVVPAHRTDTWWTSRVERIAAAAKQGTHDVVFIGDSITQAWEGAGRTEWVKNFGRYRPLNMGIMSDRTQHVLWRIDHGSLEGVHPRAAVLLIGTNNQKHNHAAEIVQGIQAIIQRLETAKPGMKIILVSILPCGEHPNKYRENLREANELLKKIVDGRDLFYVDAWNEYISPDGTISRELMPDYLHLSEKGYAILASKLNPVLDAAMKR